MLAPLAAAFADRFKLYLGKLTYPIRVGTHFNSAFGMILALEWAEANDAGLAGLIRARARDWFAADRDCQAWEPGGDEFLSSALTEALLMRRALPERAFVPWLASFLPRLEAGEPKSLFTPALVSDRSDGKIAHLDGTNLSRAWCWRGIASALEPEAEALARATADAHLRRQPAACRGGLCGRALARDFCLAGAVEQLSLREKVVAVTA